MLKMEKKLRNYFMAGVPYSPELVLHLNRINLWRILIREEKVHCKNMCTIIQLQKMYRIAGCLLKLQLTEIWQRYIECIYSYSIFWKSAAITRATFQDRQIEVLVLPGNIDASAICFKINNLESSRAQNRRIKSALCTNIFTGVTQVDTIDPLTKEVVHLRIK